MSATESAAARWASIDEIRQLWRSSQFRYIDLDDAAVLYRVPLGTNGFVAVIGHPDHGSYEWVARRPDPFDPMPPNDPPELAHSDQGYGSSAAALRDALVKMVD